MLTAAWEGPADFPRVPLLELPGWRALHVLAGAVALSALCFDWRSEVLLIAAAGAVCRSEEALK